jgi:hypothetical protein
LGAGLGAPAWVFAQKSWIVAIPGTPADAREEVEEVDEEFAVWRHE